MYTITLFFTPSTTKEYQIDGWGYHAPGVLAFQDATTGSKIYASCPFLIEKKSQPTASPASPIS